MDDFVKNAFETAMGRHSEEAQRISRLFEEYMESVMDCWYGIVGEDAAKEYVDMVMKSRIKDEVFGLHILFFTAGYTAREEESKQ